MRSSKVGRLSRLSVCGGREGGRKEGGRREGGREGRREGGGRKERRREGRREEGGREEGGRREGGREGGKEGGREEGEEKGERQGTCALYMQEEGGRGREGKGEGRRMGEGEREEGGRFRAHLWSHCISDTHRIHKARQRRIMNEVDRGTGRQTYSEACSCADLVPLSPLVPHKEDDQNGHNEAD